MKLELHQLKDVAERALATYVQSVLGLWVTGAMTFHDLSSTKALLVAAAPGALSIIKGYLASVMPIGDASASMIAAKPTPAVMADEG